MRQTFVAASAPAQSGGNSAGVNKYGATASRLRARRKLTAWSSVLFAAAVTALVLLLLVILLRRPRVLETASSHRGSTSPSVGPANEHDTNDRSSMHSHSLKPRSAPTNNNRSFEPPFPDVHSNIRSAAVEAAPNEEQPLDVMTASLSKASLFVTFSRHTDPVVHVWNWVSVAEAVVKRAVAVLTDRTNSIDMSDSRRRYRLGGLALLLGRSQARQSTLLLQRAELCDAITPRSLEEPTHQDDVLFMAYTARQAMKRQHHCFQRRSTFLVASVPPVDASNPPRSLFAQLEDVMALAYLGTSVSRTVVLPPARLPDGKIVPWAEVFDLRYFLAATVDDALPTCFLESHEFEELESSRLQLLRGGKSNQTTMLPEEATNLVWDRLDDVSCNRAPHPFEVREDRMSPSVSCTETHTALLPQELHGTNAAAVEAALDELLQEVGGSFHRIVHLGPNLLRVLSLVVPPLVNASGDFVPLEVAAASVGGASTAARRFLRCLWRTVGPHPFALRAVRLLDATLEERVPSKAVLDRTLVDRPPSSFAPGAPSKEVIQHEKNVANRSTPVVLPASIAVEDTARSTLLIPASERSDDVVLHLQPLLERGVVCLALTNQWLLVAGSDDARRNRTCGLTRAQLAEVVDVTSHSGNCVVFVHHAWNGDAEAQREAATLRNRIVRAQEHHIRAAQSVVGNAPVGDELAADIAQQAQPTNTVVVITAAAVFRRNNRFTRFVGVVTNRRKLFLGGGNALLMRGLLPSPTRAHLPFTLFNHFAAVPQLFEDSIAFWHMVLASRVMLTAPYSAFERCVAYRRWANRGYLL